MHANTPSATAYLIAASVAFSAHDPRLAPLIPPQTVTASNWVLADGLPYGRYWLWAMQQSWFRALIHLAERGTIPGIQAHYLVRKRFLEEVTRRSLQDGYRQVVVFGAGFDTLAWRLHTEFTQALFLEVDHPSTQQVKRQVLERRTTLRPNLQFSPLDLTQSTVEAQLRAFPAFCAGKNTLFVAEGLLMYLQATEVARLFACVHSLGGPQARFAFTFLERQRDGSVNFPHASRLVSWWLRQRGERFQWGVERDGLADYLSVQGFRLVELADAAAFRRRYLDSLPTGNISLAEGEFTCVTERL